MASITPIESRRILELVDGFPKTDSGNAERLIALSGRELRYVRTWSKWIAWNGKHWTLDEGAPHRAAKAMARALMKQAQRIDDPDARSAAVRYSLKCEGKASIEAMVSLARYELAVAIGHEELDADPWLLCVRNGTIDLKTGELRPHRREDLITKIAPIDYDPAATCNRFERFVSEIMAGDAALVTFIHRFLGYCMTGDVREHILAFWHGEGGNGKSMLADLVLFVMGDYACKAAPDLLFKGEHSERHPTELCDLYGRRLVVCNETTSGRSWDEATVKDITGGDRIRARRMREDFREFSPSHKLLVFGNHRPRIRCVDKAMERRLRLVPFAVSFIGREDKDLKQALKAEGPGVLAWLVRGCLQWQAEGLPDVAAVRDATQAYLRDEDTLGQFFDGECVFDPTAKISRKELRDRYVAWCDDRDERPVSPKTIADAITRRAVVPRKVWTAKGPRDGWAGIRLANEAERTTASDIVTPNEEIPVQRDQNVSREITRELPTMPTSSLDGDQEDFGDYLEREGIGGEE